MSDEHVVDTSVLTKLAFQEADSDRVRRWILSLPTLIAPDHIRLEMASVALKKHRAGLVAAGAAAIVASRTVDLVTELAESGPLVTPALDIAERSGCSLYDALFAALAVARQAPLVSGDEPMLKRLSRIALGVPLVSPRDLP